MADPEHALVLSPARHTTVQSLQAVLLCLLAITRRGATSVHAGARAHHLTVSTRPLNASLLSAFFAVSASSCVAILRQRRAPVAAPPGRAGGASLLV